MAWQIELSARNLFLPLGPRPWPYLEMSVSQGSTVAHVGGVIDSKAGFSLFSVDQFEALGFARLADPAGIPGFGEALPFGRVGGRDAHPFAFLVTVESDPPVSQVLWAALEAPPFQVVGLDLLQNFWIAGGEEVIFARTINHPGGRPTHVP